MDWNSVLERTSRFLKERELKDNTLTDFELLRRNAVVLIRGREGIDGIDELAKNNGINIVGVFNDYRKEDSEWAMERYEDRLAFTKAVERDASTMIVQSDFFEGIGDYVLNYKENLFEQKLICRALTKLKVELLVVSKDRSRLFDSSLLFGGMKSNAFDAEDALSSVQRYEKLIMALTKLRKKVLNKKSGIVTLKGEGKVSGRKSYSETNPELVSRAKELRGNGYKLGEISKLLYDMGFKNSKGNEIGAKQVSRIIKQANGNG